MNNSNWSCCSEHCCCMRPWCSSKCLISDKSCWSCLNIWLFLLRVGFWLLFLWSWIGKFQATPEMQQMIGGAGHLLGLTFLSATTWFHIAQWGEIIGWALLILGWGTKLGSFLLLVIMIAIMNMKGWNFDMMSPNNAVYDWVFALVALSLWFTGPGKWSLGGCCSSKSMMVGANVCKDGCCSDKANCECGDCDACTPSTKDDKSISM